MINWIERQGLHKSYMIHFGKPCCPVDYPPGIEPTGELTAVVTTYCLEIGKPYEQIDIKTLEEWMKAKGYPIDNISWRSQLDSK